MAIASETIYSTLVAASAVTALVSTRIWPDRRNNTTLPSITFQTIAENRHDWLPGPGAAKRVRIQVNCYAATRLAADQLGDAVEATLSATGRIVFRQSTYDAEAQIYWTQLDWSVAIASP